MKQVCLRDIFLPWIRIYELYRLVGTLEHKLHISYKENRTLLNAINRASSELSKR